MADFLTESPGDSDMPAGQVSWKPVDASEPELEKKMQAFTTQPKVQESDPPPAASTSAGFEADFSEPEEVTIKQPLLGKSVPSLPDSSTLP